MGSLEKYTNDQVAMICGHNGRTHTEYGNKDIDASRTHLNYKLSPDHFIKDEKTGELSKISDYKYFQIRTGELYLYGRGSKREKDAITAAGWVTTCPKEIVGDSEKESAFFKGVYQFYEDRYGKENCISAYCHYDEGGNPHMHFLFIPVTTLDIDKVHFRTKKNTKVITTESGRREYEIRFVHDKEGNKIPVKNYAKMADYYTEKISGADVLNRAELKSIHYDMQAYLKAHGIEGKVINGATGSSNVSVKELKAFTAHTGLRINEVKGIDRSKTILENFVDQQKKTITVEASLSEKNARIARLEETVTNQKERIENLKGITHDYDRKLSEKDQGIRDKIAENETLKEKIKTLESGIEERDRHIDELQVSADNSKSSLERTVESKDKEISQLNNELSAKKEELKKANEKLHELEKERTVNQKETVITKDNIWNSSSGSEREQNMEKEHEVTNDMLW